MDWLKTSIMHTRGVANGGVGATHELTEARQGKYHFTIGPYTDPVLSIRPGDRVVVQTRDAFDSKVKTAQDLPSKAPRRATCSPSTSKAWPRAATTRAAPAR
jgi:hypothetical protein